MSSQELIGKNIRRLRTVNGISQVRLAELAGIDRSYVSRLERMVENPSLAILDKIALALNVPTAELFNAEGLQSNLRPLKAGRPRKVPASGD